MTPVDFTAISVCIDDFGRYPGINDAALHLLGIGAASAVSAQVTGPHWADGACVLRHMAPAQADVGLHLDLTDLPFDRSLRAPLAGWMLRTASRAVPRTRLRREIERQLDVFVEHLGRAPSHVDGHQHVHQLPVVRDILLDALQRRRWSPWIRISRPTRVDSLKAMVLRACGSSALRRSAQRSGMRTLPDLLGVYDFRADVEAYRHHLDRWLLDARPGAMLMCHPSVSSAGPEDTIAHARTTEYDVLAGAAWKTLLRVHRVMPRTLSPARQMALDARPGSTPFMIPHC